MFVLCALLGFVYDCCTLLCIAINSAVHLVVTHGELWPNDYNLFILNKYFHDYVFILDPVQRF